VIAVESKEALKDLTEHDFREAFKKWQSRCISEGGGYFEGDGDQ
jgi:hypothetical protein